MNRPHAIDPSKPVPGLPTDAVRQPAAKRDGAPKHIRTHPMRTVLVVTDTGTVLLLRSPSR